MGGNTARATPRVESTRNFSTNLDPSSLSEGSYTFIAEPMPNWAGRHFETVFLPALAWFLTAIFWIIAFFSVPANVSNSLMFHAITLGPALLFSIRCVVRSRKDRNDKRQFPRMKFVFYQPKARPASQAYRHEATDTRATYEVYFQGEVKERGFVSSQKPILLRESNYCRAEKRVKTTASIQLPSDIDPASLDTKDPFRKEHTSSYLIFERYAAQSSVEKIKELRDFLGLPVHSEHDLHVISKRAQAEIAKGQYS